MFSLSSSGTAPIVPGPQSVSASITYKPNGQVDIIGGYGGTQHFEYDSRGLPEMRTLSFQRKLFDIDIVNVGTFQYSYDPVGRNTLLVYPDGHERHQVYDAIGRLSSRCYRYFDGTLDRCYSAQYDAIGNPEILTDPEMRLEVEYDALDCVFRRHSGGRSGATWAPIPA